jgi:hypothetical protein
VTVKEIASELNWTDPVVYKYAKRAAKTGIVEYEPRTRARNVKGIIAREDESGTGFLPSPRLVLENNSTIGSEVRFVDPFTGTWATIERSR